MEYQHLYMYMSSLWVTSHFRTGAQTSKYPHWGHQLGLGHRTLWSQQIGRGVPWPCISGPGYSLEMGYPQVMTWSIYIYIYMVYIYGIYIYGIYMVYIYGIYIWYIYMVYIYMVYIYVVYIYMVYIYIMAHLVRWFIYEGEWNMVIFHSTRVNCRRVTMRTPVGGHTHQGYINHAVQHTYYSNWDYVLSKPRKHTFLCPFCSMWWL